MPPRAPRRRTTATPVSDWTPGQPHLLSVTHTHPDWSKRNPRFPFTVPTIASLGTLDMDASVICFAGENGSGKSTLLEAIAIAANLPSAGSADLTRADPTLEDQAWLSKALKLTWRTRSNRGFFLRAEDFFGFQKQLQTERAEFESTLRRMEEEYASASEKARQLAMGPIKASLADMERRYGADPDARSHGEAFINFFQQRIVPNGLYLLDEPEAALSPQRQLALLAMMFEMVAEGAQFIIATHSPLVLAYPGAKIYSFDSTPVSVVPWDELDHVTLTRSFLADPERYLRRLRDTD